MAAILSRERWVNGEPSGRLNIKMLSYQWIILPNGNKIDSIFYNRKWQDYVYIQCEYKSTKQKIKHLLREENKVKENKIS